MPGTLFTVSAPSGTGKTSLIRRAQSRLPQLMLSVSCTTRPPRPGECCGRDYHFVNPARFAQMVRDGAFLEHAEVFGHNYGTCRQWVEEQLQGGHSVVLEIDWQGAAQVKSLAPDCCAIFILPPGLQTLAERLRTRGEDSPEVIEHRLAEARADMQRYKSADFLVVNADFDSALDRLCDIFRGRIAPTPIEQQAKQLYKGICADGGQGHISV